MSFRSLIFANGSRPSLATINEAALVGCMIVVYYLCGLSASATKCTTFDEPLHLTGGYSYWLEHDYRLNPEAGNLPQRWAALPLLAGDFHFPALDSLGWKTGDTGYIGREFFYLVGNDVDEMLFRGRGAVGLWGAALATLVYLWARRLWGQGGAWVAVTLAAACPTALAHGFLITSDMTAAFFFVAAVGSLWGALHRLSWMTLAANTAAVAGLFLSKFSAPLLVPMGLLMLAVRLIPKIPWSIELGIEREIHSRLAKLAIAGALMAWLVVTTWVAIWLSFGCRYSMVEPNGQPVVMMHGWSQLIDSESTVGRVIETAREHQLLPEPYLYGFAFTHRFSQQRRAFLNGEYSINGWLTFFPYCLLVKTPLPFFVLLGFSLAALFYRCRTENRPAHEITSADMSPPPTDATSPAQQAFTVTSATDWQALGKLAYQTAPLWALFIVYWAFALASHLNIGQRHILPTYAVMYLFAAGAIWWLQRPQPKEATSLAIELTTSVHDRATSAAKEFEVPPASALTNQENWYSKFQQRFRYPAAAIVVLACLAWYVVESWSCWPNYLAYFNPLDGGPSQAYHHLVDSSLDWGQDLPALAQWLDEQGLGDRADRRVYLSYFGTGYPKYYGINAALLPCFFDQPRPIQTLEPGVYCISATMLQSVYNQQTPGPWNAHYESTYQQYLAQIQDFEKLAASPEARDQLLQQHAGQFDKMYRQFDELRLARLCAYLRHQTPEASINFSILVYRLTRADLDRALFGPAPE